MLPRSFVLQVLIVLLFGTSIAFQIRQLARQGGLGRIRVYGTAYLLVSVFALLTGAARSFGRADYAFAVGYDVFTVVACGSAVCLVGLTPRRMKLWLLVYTAISAVFAVLILSEINLSAVTAAEHRGLAYATVRSWWTYYVYHRFYGLSPLIVMLTFSIVKSNGYRALALCHVLFFVFWAAYFGKRDAFVEVAMLALFFLAPWSVASGERGWPRIGSIVIMACVISMMGYALTLDVGQDLGDRLLDRFSSDLSALSRVDRVEEAIAVLRTFDIVDVLCGRGLGSSSEHVIGGHILHIGIANIFFKGGVIAAFLVVGTLVMNLLESLSMPRKRRILVLGMSAYVLIKLLYSQLWGYLPIVMLLGVGLLARPIALTLSDGSSPAGPRMRR